MLVGVAGVPWLMAMTHADLGATFRTGVRPFLVGDALKVLLAAGLLPTAWRVARR